MSTNEDLVRWLGAAVIKAGGSVELTPEDVRAPLELSIKALAGSDNLIISAYVVDDEED